MTLCEGKPTLLKGNEALAHAAIRYGVDAYFGYPITPQSEVLETLAAQKPWETTGMVVLQAESEVGAINMVYGAAATGRRAMTSTSGPGISLMQEGISYIAGARLPCLVVNVMRGGPGLGTIQPSQSDYFQAVKGGGHGDYKLYTLAPASVQEMCDFLGKAFDWAFAHRNPAMILADGTIGQMMETAVLPPQHKRLTSDEIASRYPWASVGFRAERGRNLISSLELDPLKLEANLLETQRMYAQAELDDALSEETDTQDAEYVLVAFGSAARICKKCVELARARSIKLGLLRPVTLWPFPKEALRIATKNAKHVLTVEMNAGQMVEDVRLTLENMGKQISHYGRLGGVVFTPEEILQHLERIINNRV